jgi:hypothetical protein
VSTLCGRRAIVARSLRSPISVRNRPFPTNRDKFNRQTPELERHVTYRKQRIALSSNRQKIHFCKTKKFAATDAKHLSNRELRLLESPLTHGKQKIASRSNRELSTNPCCHNSRSDEFRQGTALAVPDRSKHSGVLTPEVRFCPFLTGLPRAFFAKGSVCTRPFLTGSTPQTEFDVTRSKQTPEKFLTGARMHIKDFEIRHVHVAHLFRGGAFGFGRHSAPTTRLVGQVGCCLMVRAARPRYEKRILTNGGLKQWQLKSEQVRCTFVRRTIHDSEARLPISAPDAIDPAFRHAKEQLFRPFRLGQWTRLALVGFLAGELGSSGGCNGFNYHVPANTQHPASQQAFLAGSWPAQLANHTALFTGIVLAVILIGFVLVVVFTYIGSVMRFILFDSVIAKECHIRAGWARRRGPGLRLFCWQIVFMLVSSAAILIVIGIPVVCAWAVGWFAHAREHVAELVLGGIGLLLVLFVLLLFFGVVQVMTRDFVVPQMALEDIGAVEGWRRLWVLLKAEKGGYAGYIGMKIVLAVGAAIAVTIVAVIALFVMLIPVGGAGVVAFLAAKAAGWTWNYYTIMAAVALGTIALAIIFFVLSLISVPVIVFFPAYSIYFFAQRYPPLASLLWPQPPAPVVSG